MRTGTWIAYVLWVAFFGVLGHVVMLVIASQAFGISATIVGEQPCVDDGLFLGP